MVVLTVVTISCCRTAAIATATVVIVLVLVLIGLLLLSTILNILLLILILILLILLLILILILVLLSCIHDVVHVVIHIRGKSKQRTYSWNNTTYECASTCRVSVASQWGTDTMCSNGDLDEDLNWLDVHNIVTRVKEAMDL